jgi:Na+-transporting methylmalonyl-CoA/oxaloacetate decarboxylase gamma subunit
MKKGLIIGGIALAVIVLGLTLVVAILTMSKFIATGGVEKSIPTTQGSIQTKNIQAIDSEVFNSKTPLTIYTSKVS